MARKHRIDTRFCVDRSCLHNEKQLMIWGPSNGVYEICIHCGRKKGQAMQIPMEERLKLTTVWPIDFLPPVDPFPSHLFLN